MPGAEARPRREDAVEDELADLPWAWLDRFLFDERPPVHRSDLDSHGGEHRDVA